MKVAVLTTDNRDCNGDYERPEPYFGMGTARFLAGIEECPGLELHIVSCTRKPVRAPEKLGERVWFHSLTVPRAGWMRSAYLGCVLATRAKLREIRPDIVHGHGTERDCALSAAFSGFPNVVTVRGNMRSIARLYGSRPFSYFWVSAKLESIALSRARGVICLTHYTQREVADCARRTWIIPNAADPTFFELPREPQKPAMILCIGTICPHKNQVRLIHALDRIVGEIPFEAVFIGDSPAGEYADTFRALARERSWCRLTGHLSQTQIASEMEGASLVVLPSLEDNCPNVVLESMAGGIPVAAADIGGVPDLIVSDETGLLFDPLDEEQIADAVRRLLQDRSLSERVSVAGQEAARRRFLPAVIAEAHMRVYREVLGTVSAS